MLKLAFLSVAAIFVTSCITPKAPPPPRVPPLSEAEINKAFYRHVAEGARKLRLRQHGQATALLVK